MSSVSTEEHSEQDHTGSEGRARCVFCISGLMHIPIDILTPIPMRNLMHTPFPPTTLRR